jgi:hypothetical protein
VTGQINIRGTTGLYLYAANGTTFRAAFHDDGTRTRLFADGNGSNAHMTFNGGNVGIGLTGTNHPSARLHVQGSGATVTSLVECTDGNQVSLDLKNSEGHYRIITNGGELQIYDQTDSRQPFTIDTGGTTTLKGGTADTSDHTLIIRNSSNTSLFSIRNDGRIDLGGSQIFDISRNMSNIGTISSGAITSSGAVKTANGTESLPAYSFTSDTDTGMFSDTANQLEFSTGGDSKVTINPSGHLLCHKGEQSVLNATTTSRGIWVSSDTNGESVSYNLALPDGSNNRRATISLDDSTGLWVFDTTASSGVPDIVFKRAGSEKGRFTSSGLSVNGATAISGNYNTSAGGYQINGITVINSSRNLTNIGTISSGNITATRLVSDAGNNYSQVKLSGDNGTNGNSYRFSLNNNNTLLLQRSTDNFAANATLALTIDSSQVATFENTINVKSQSSLLQRWYEGSTEVGRAVGVSGVQMAIGSGDTGVLFNASVNAVYPWQPTTNAGLDNIVDLGISSRKWRDIYFGGNLKHGSTTVIDSSRNLTNIGTIASGAITSSGTFTLSGTGTDNDSHMINFVNGACAIARDNNDLELHAYNAMVFGVSNTSYPTSTERMRIDSSGVQITGTLDVDVISNASGVVHLNDTLYFQDNSKAVFGDSSDLQIYHDGSHSRIDDTGTGKLILRGSTDVEIHKYTGEYMITATADGAVTLYHDDSAKLATTSTGIDVAGSITTDDYRTDGSNVFYLTSASDWRFRKTSGTEHARLTAAGQFLINQTSSNGDILEVTGDANVFAGRLNGSTTGGQSYGLRIRAGTNSTDKGLLIENTGGTDLFAVCGDGTIDLAGTQILDSSRNLTNINTISSGNISSFTNSSTSSSKFGRFAGQEIEISTNDLTNAIKAVQDSDSNGDHNFNLNREFAGSGANNFNIQKAGTNQLSIDTNGDAFFAGNISINDNKSIGIGTANDMLIKHDGSNTIFKEQGDGNVIFEVTDATIQFKKGTTETLAEFIPDSGSLLYHDNVLKFATTSDGASTSGNHNATGYRLSGIQIVDASRNLTNINEISLASELNFTGNGNKIIDVSTKANSNNFKIRHHDPSDNSFETAIQFTAGGGAAINHAGSTKLATTSTGIDVTGRIDLDDSNTQLSSGSGNSLRVQTNSGQLELGAQNTSYAHIATDRTQFYFNKFITVDGGIFNSYNEDAILRRAGSSSNQITIGSSGITATLPFHTTGEGDSIGHAFSAEYYYDESVGDSDGADTKWTLKDANGTDVTSTTANKVYRVRLVTLGTGTNTGSVWLADNVDGAGWRVKAVSVNTSPTESSNYPKLEIDSSVPKVSLEHTTAYNVRIFIEEYNTGNSGGMYTIFGTDALLTYRDNGGRIGIARETPGAKLDIGGNVAISGAEIITTARNLTNIGTISSGAITSSSTVVASGSITSGGTLKASSSELLVRNVSGWTVPDQTALGSYYGSNLGDYIYLKAPGNSTSAHGIALVTDNAFFYGRTSIETGQVTNSATAPLDENTGFKVTYDGTATFAGTISSGAISSSSTITASSHLISDNSGGGSVVGKTSGSNEWFVGGMTAGLGSGDGLLLYTYDSGSDIKFYVAGSHKFTMTNTGNFQVGSTTVMDSSRNLTNIGTYAGSGSVLLGSTSSNFSELTAVGSLELCRTDANGFIDFRSAVSEDFDCRIQQISNGLVFSTGGNGSTATALTLDSARNAQFASMVDIPSKLRHLGDTDTCLNFTTDTITLETAGAARVAIDSSGLAIGNGSILTRIKSLSSSGFTDTVIENFSSGAYRERLRINSSGSFLAGITSQVGIGGTPADENAFELGRGYLNLARDDTASAKQITFGKNGAVHSYIETTSSGLNLGLSANNLITVSSSNQVFRVEGTNIVTFESDGVTIAGDLSKSSGSFKIDHPLKPDTHHLVHSFVEGPQADNLYRGTITLQDGRAVIDLDEWFGMTPGTFLALNRDIQAFVSNIDDWDAVRAKMMGSQLVIECQNAESKASVSWLVVGERQDKAIYDSTLTDDNGKIIVEPLKEVVE